jgi:hypothetical protein
MPSPAQTWERRRLNEEIEEAFITAAKAASNIEMKMSFGKGTIFGDAQDFYLSFSYLIRLTISLKEMDCQKGSDLEKLKIRIDVWIKRKLTQSAQTPEIDMYLKDGLGVFNEYYKSLMHQGIIALPTKKG